MAASDLSALPADQTAPVPERLALATVALATTLAPLNSTMLAVALPSIMTDFGADVSTAGWLVTAYLIVMASIQPVGGKLGDRLGRRRLILLGLVYFGIASLAAAAAPSLPLLIFFRVQQAIAGAIALPNGVALIREVLPAHRRSSGFGMVGSATSLAAAGGPLIGGLLVGLGWRAIFLVNVPIVLAALYVARSLPSGARDRPRHAFDLIGALLLSLLLVGATALMTGGRLGRSPVDPWLGGLALLALAGLFIWLELRHPDPLIRPRLFRHRAFAAANVVVMLSNLAMYSTLLAVPLLFARQGVLTSAQVGVVLAILFSASIVCAPLGGRLADRLGRRRAAVIGLMLLTLGLLPLALGGAGVELPPMLAGLCLVGVGTGLSGAPVQTSAVESVAAAQAGMAAGVFSTSRYFGSIVGSIVLSALLSGDQGIAGFGSLFVGVFLAAALAVVASMALRDRPALISRGR